MFGTEVLDKYSCDISYQRSASATIMGGDTERPSSKHKKSRTKDSDTSSKKRHRRDDGQHRESKKKHKAQTHDSLKVIDDDPDDDVWVEKNIDMDGEHVSPV